MAKIKPIMKKYSIISDAIERGINYGYQRAYKHTDAPDRDMIIDQILNGVMASLDEVIDFEDE